MILEKSYFMMMIMITSDLEKTELSRIIEYVTQLS